MPTFQARQDRLSLTFWSEAFPSATRRLWDLLAGTSPGWDGRSNPCDRLPRLVSNASRGEGADSSAVRSRCCGPAPDARRGRQPMERSGCARLSSGARQPMRCTDDAKADYLAPGVSAVSELLRRVSR